MAHLVLNPAGEARARTQYRCFEYLKLLVTAAGYAPDAYGLGETNRDRYLGDCIQRTDILEHVIRAAGCTAAGPSSMPPDPDSPRMDLHLPEAVGNAETALPATDPAEAHRRYRSYCAEVDRVHPDPLHPAPELATTETYFRHVDHLFSSLVYVEKLMDTPKIDWNADRFTLDYSPCPDEVKLVINLDAEAISAADNNKDLKDRANWCGNGVWYVMILNFFIGLSLSLPILTIPFYLTNLGANASQTANIQTFFNLAQLFFCPMWLWLSEIIGRRPVYIILFAGYIVASALTVIAPFIFQSHDNTTTNSQSQISYILGMRFITGIFAYAIPIAFVTVTDLASPRSRPLALIAVNLVTQFGTGIASIVVAFIFAIGTYANDSVKSFLHSFYLSIALLMVGLILSCFLRESSAGVVARRAAKKMGRTNSEAYRTSVKRDSLWVTLKDILKNKELILLWFAYVFQLLCSQLPVATKGYLVAKFYGFTNAQKAKQLNALSDIASILVTVCFALGPTRVMARKIGKLRVIVIAIYFAMTSSLLRWAIDPPIPKWIMFLPFNTIALGLGDALFIQFATLYTTPKNRRTLLGLFQIGNSVGRFGGALMGGELYNWNWRNGSLFFLLYGFASLLLLCFVRPPLEQNTAGEMEQKQREQAKRQALV
ncbi:Transporter, MFS superfamily [Giardia duodenalis]|uniref:Transporter, MFS superfamily n=1 Tax=Giardia intestinalis TaxID=5741 RepID=V6U3A4_GIAIN|nr:Transporter, MFS superfamily [Giardia intestinalis]